MYCKQIKLRNELANFAIQPHFSFLTIDQARLDKISADWYFAAPFSVCSIAPWFFNEPFRGEFRQQNSAGTAVFCG
ncbi:MAG: hypothetical protein ACWGMZ_01450 [Thermoguttaceae bacterium]